MEKRESKLLQIVSIVTIIFTVLGLLVSIAAQLFAAQLLASAETAGAQNVSTPVFITILGYSCRPGSPDLQSGVCGVQLDHVADDHPAGAGTRRGDRVDDPHRYRRRGRRLDRAHHGPSGAVSDRSGEAFKNAGGMRNL